jgi:hypothetical protein
MTDDPAPHGGDPDHRVAVVGGGVTGPACAAVQRSGTAAPRTGPQPASACMAICA